MRVQVPPWVLRRGRLAQLVRAPRLHRGGRGFNSYIVHLIFNRANSRCCHRFEFSAPRVAPRRFEPYTIHHMKFLSASEKETLSFAKKFSKNLTGGLTIGLIGNLGAGKTIFTKGLAAGLGIKKNITSPTFILMRVYSVKRHRIIKTLVHIDAYRIKSTRDLMAIGADEYFNRPDTITVIEWADRIKPILPKKTKFVKINLQKNNLRKIIF